MVTAGSTGVKNPGSEDKALVCPRKGLLVISGVEVLNPGVRSQNKKDITLRLYILCLPAEPKANTLF